MALLLLAIGVVGCGSTHRPPTRSVASTSTTTTSVSRPASTSTSDEWLGLAYNSSSGIGAPGDFASHGVVYDRSGLLETVAGETAAATTTLGRGLRISIDAGMAPDVEVDPASSPSGCTGDPNATTACLPVSEADVRAYVHGFVATAISARARFPNARIVFEPMNEPWSWGDPPGTASGREAASQYAAILAALIPAARAAGIPLTDIYVPATGTLSDGSRWIPDLYRAQPCLAPGQATCGPIGGWSLHPYGLPGSTTEGIDSVPRVRADMASGRDNVFVTEVGFCSRQAYAGRNCLNNQPDIVGDAAQTASWMSETLDAALAMHRAGWLRALIVWDRGGDGWSMENGDGSLTASGKVLIRFADQHSAPPGGGG